VSSLEPDEPDLVRLVKQAQRKDHDSFMQVAWYVVGEVRQTVEACTDTWSPNEREQFAESVITHAWRLIRGCPTDSSEAILEWFSFLVEAKLKRLTNPSVDAIRSPLAGLHRGFGEWVSGQIGPDQVGELLWQASECLSERHQRLLFEALTSTRVLWHRREAAEVRAAVAELMAAADRIATGWEDLAPEGG
jgi:hypothetical protein